MMVLNTKEVLESSSFPSLHSKQTNSYEKKNIWSFLDNLHLCPAFVLCCVFPFLIIIFRPIPDISLTSIH